MIEEILVQLGCFETPLSVEQFLSEEDGEPYQVWKLQFPGKEMVLKEAKGYEAETYRAFFYAHCAYAPRLYAAGNVNGKEYLLMEYIAGETMTKCTRTALKSALDSLIEMQKAYWGSEETAGWNVSHAAPGRENRAKYLNSPELEAVYTLFLQEFKTVPRTLCHDDLLPFNVIVNQDHALLIDWEFGGILPYPVSLARLIAHGEEMDDALFYMKEEDKAFALAYYYSNFIYHQGIDRHTYYRTMALFLFYEYCEWVYLGNKYPEVDRERYREYLNKASMLAASITGS